MSPAWTRPAALCPLRPALAPAIGTNTRDGDVRRAVATIPGSTRGRQSVAPASPPPCAYGGALATLCEIWYQCDRLGDLCDRFGAPVMMDDAIGMASDHAGFALKQALKHALQNDGGRVVDLGVDDPSPVDYPDFGYAMAHALREGRVARGVLICGSGIGISIAANRYPAVRAALIHDELGARLAREHNDANVICFGGRMIAADVALGCLRVFLATPFEAGRHCRRVDKLSNPKLSNPL